MELAGKVAFITGGGGGIGAGIAEAFAEKGMRLVLADIVENRARAIAASISPDVLAVPLDVTDLESWAAAREAAFAQFGRVDVLCNNAGISLPVAQLADVAPETFDHAMRVNVFGVYNGIRTFIPEMTSRGSGHVVNTSSMLGLMSAPGRGTYCASKFAVKAMGDALRAELGPQGIGVSTLYPAATRSYMTMEGPSSKAAKDESWNLMEPIWLGRAVVKAVEQNLPHIITHPRSKAGVEAVAADVLAAFGEPAQPGYPG